MLFPLIETGAKASPHTTGSGEPFARLIEHALGRKAWLLGSAVFGLLITLLVLTFIPPIYEAQAVIIVDSRRNKLADDESALSSIVVDQYYGALKSELELILSPDLARHVITSLNLLQTSEYASARDHVATAAYFARLRTYLLSLFGAPPESESPPLTVVSTTTQTTDPAMQTAIKLFHRSFWAENEPKSLTIRLGYKSQSPELAAAVTNAALQRYLTIDEEIKTAALLRSETWLAQRIAVLRKSLEAAEQAVEHYRADQHLATDRAHSPLEQTLLQLESQRVTAMAAVAAAQAKVAHGAQGDDAAATNDVLGSKLIQGLRLQEASLIAERSRFSATMLPDHPSVRRVTDALTKLRTAIRTEVQRISQANDDDLRQAQQRLADVNGQIQTAHRQIEVANSADVRLRALEQDATAKRAVLTAFTTRHDQEAGTPLTPPDSRVVSWASVPVDPVSPKYGLTLAGGVFCTVILAFAASLGFERLRAGFGDIRQLEYELGLVVAGITPALRRLKRRPLSRSRLGDSAPIRELALTVRAFAHRTPVPDAQVVLVTSAIAGEGKSMMAVSLARSAANGGQRCLLIDADIRKPTLHVALGVPATPGLVELTRDGTPISGITRGVSADGFDFISAGRPTSDPLSPFTMESFGRVLAELKQSYDLIVIDSAPVLLAPEGLVISAYASLTLFVVKWRTTPREIARKAAQLLTRSSAGPCLSILAQVNLKHLRRDERRMEFNDRRAYHAR